MSPKLAATRVPSTLHSQPVGRFTSLPTDNLWKQSFNAYSILLAHRAPAIPNKAKGTSCPKLMVAKVQLQATPQCTLLALTRSLHSVCSLIFVWKYQSNDIIVAATCRVAHSFLVEATVSGTCLVSIVAWGVRPVGIEWGGGSSVYFPVALRDPPRAMHLPTMILCRTQPIPELCGWCDAPLSYPLKPRCLYIISQSLGRLDSSWRVPRPQDKFFRNGS